MKEKFIVKLAGMKFCVCDVHCESPQHKEKNEIPFMMLQKIHFLIHEHHHPYFVLRCYSKKEVSLSPFTLKS
jgi:hypothetical protein